MKKLLYLALLAMAVMTTATAFVSCGDDDDDPLNESTTEQKSAKMYDVEFMSCIFPGQDSYFNMSYTFDINGTEKTVDFTQMSLVSDSTTISDSEVYTNALQITKAFEDLKAPKTVKAYLYCLGKATTGKYTLKKVTYTPRTDRPADSEINAMFAVGFYGDRNTKCDTQIYLGVKADQTSLDKFCSIVNEGDPGLSFSF